MDVRDGGLAAADPSLERPRRRPRARRPRHPAPGAGPAVPLLSAPRVPRIRPARRPRSAVGPFGSAAPRSPLPASLRFFILPTGCWPCCRRPPLSAGWRRCTRFWPGCSSGCTVGGGAGAMPRPWPARPRGCSAASWSLEMWQVVDAALCWLPLALYFLEGWLRESDGRQAAGLAVALGMSLLAGDVQFAFYVWLTVCAYALYRLRVTARLIPLAGLLALGAALAAVQLAAHGGPAAARLAAERLLRGPALVGDAPRPTRAVGGPGPVWWTARLDPPCLPGRGELLRDDHLLRRGGPGLRLVRAVPARARRC